MRQIISAAGLSFALAFWPSAVVYGDLIDNGSFESPVLADGASSGVLSDWTSTNVGNGAWYTTNPQNAYIDGSTYVSEEQPGYLPSPADGLQTAYAYLGDTAVDSPYFHQSVGNPVANTLYTLTFAVGMGKPRLLPTWDVYLLDSTLSVVYAHMNSGDEGVNLPTAGTFAGNTISWKNEDVSTDELVVFFRATGVASGATEILIDNVRLTASAIPEPGTLFLLSTGFVGLLAYAWRKRR